MKKIIIIASALILVGVAFFLYFTFFQSPDISKYKYLENPLISTKPDQKVLEVKFELDSKDLQKAFGLLFKSYFGIKDTPKGSKMEAPMARYENAIDFDMESAKRNEAYKAIKWKGSAAMPLPESVTSIKEKGEYGLKPELGLWKYGEVAEILHYGPYEKEPGSVNKLKDYINEKGYEIAGYHEEVYIVGPGIIYSNPEKYVTIIRYQVKKKNAK